MDTGCIPPNCQLFSVHVTFLDPVSLHTEIFVFAVSKNVARKLFRFGVGTEKFTRRNEFFLVPFFPKSGLSFSMKMVRNFVSSILLSFGRFRGREEDLYSLL